MAACWGMESGPHPMAREAREVYLRGASSMVVEVSVVGHTEMCL